MRYLYHQGGRNHGPVHFEQLRQLAEAGTIDNMTPVLAEGAAAWSRWLFIKEQPPTAPKPTEPEPAKEPPTPKAAPAAPTGAKQAAPARPKAPTPATTPKKAAPAPSAKAEPVATGSPVDRTAAPAPLPATANRREQLLSYLPAAIAAPVLVLGLCATLVWQLEVNDLRAQTEQRAAYARQQAERCPEFNTLQQQLQEQEAQKVQLTEALAANTAKLSALKQELAKLGSPGSGTGEIDAKIAQLRDKIKELDKQTADLSK